MTQQEQGHKKKQWVGVEASPIDLTETRQQPRITGYDEDLDDDTLYPSRLPSTARRYRTDERNQHISRPRQQGVKKLDRYDEVNVYVRRRSAPRQGDATRQQALTTTQDRRSTRQTEPVTTDNEDEEPTTQPPNPTQDRTHQVPRFHWLMWAGIGMLTVLLVWVVGVVVVSWWQGWQDDLHYGRPRTSQTDARVGHNDANVPSHFIALNLHGHVEVIEFPGGDATKAKVYPGPSLTGQKSDLDIVTVSFRDVNGDGKPDLIVDVNGIKYPFLNDNGAFRPPHADEQVNL